MKIAFIATGDEILMGIKKESHLEYLAKQISPLGYKISRFFVVSDSTDELKNVLKQTFGCYDWVIIAGGIGPTTDDNTAKAVAEYLQKDLVSSQEVLADILDKARHRPTLKISESYRNQAKIIDGFQYLTNEFGIAPGQYMCVDESVRIMLLPGPKTEFQSMVKKHLLKHLKDSNDNSELLYTRVLRTCCIPESLLQDYIKNITLTDQVNISYCASPNQVDIRLDCYNKSKDVALKQIHEVEVEIRNLIEEYIFGVGRQNLAHVVGVIMRRNKVTLSTAESCTGGMIAKEFTDFAGSSKYFKMGWVTYSDEAKQHILKIPKDILNKNGAVSSEVAVRMADMARKKARSDYSIAVTGIAGPDGATEDKPIGLVYIAIAMRNEVQVQKFNFTGSREEIRKKTTVQAINLLRNTILN